MATRPQFGTTAFVLVCALITAALDEKSNQISSKSSLADCLRKCSLVRLESFKREESVFLSSCYKQCLKRSKASQQALFGPIFKRRSRKSLSNYCPLPSSNQTVDWSPSEINVTFGQYDNTSHWYVNISWTPMNDPYRYWTGILLRFAYITEYAQSALCGVFPKNQTLIKLNITPYGYEYPDAIFMNVIGLPFSSQLDENGSVMQSYEPITLSSSTPSPDVPTGVRAISVSSSTPSPDVPTGVRATSISSSTPSPDVPTGVRATSISSSTPSPDVPTGVRATSISSSTPSPDVPTGVRTTSGPNQTPVIASVSVGVLVGLVLVVGLLKYFLFSRRSFSPQDFGSEFEYQAFIIFNKEDEHWVTAKLLPLLEGKHNLKCCIHYRDFKPGLPFQNSMAESVYKSNKIIAVFSNNFVKSNYCSYELDIAKYRLLNKQDDSLIIIRIDKVDYNKLPRKLQKRNFIDYSNLLERPFWEEKLLKFLHVSNDQSETVEQNFESTSNDVENVMNNNNNTRCDFSRLNSTTSNETQISNV